VNYIFQIVKGSSSLLSKNLKIKKYRNIILPVVLYGCEERERSAGIEYLGCQNSENDNVKCRRYK
jgi:hypothetical protein